jgi:hypothetical protein
MVAVCTAVACIMTIVGRLSFKFTTRSAPIIHSLSTSDGIYDDFAFLFNPVLCAAIPPLKLAAYHRRFQYFFRVDPPTFTFLMKHLQQDLKPTRRNSRGRAAIPATIVIATSLIYLSTGNTFASTALIIRNGISETSVSRCIRMFTKSVTKRLASKLITFPLTQSGLRRNADAFEARSLIPNIIGAIDGSHIRVAAPKHDESSFYNRKSFHSIILQAIVDPRGYFMSADCGFPGRMSDPKVLRYTPVYVKAMTWFGRFGFYIYGDAAYPLLPWLMTGYRHQPTHDQELFNHHGSKARIIVEAAFGKLKGQWRCLSVGLRTRSPSQWKDTVVTCVCLHNLSILISRQGWGWGAGIVHDTEPAAFAQDPNPVGNHGMQRIRDDIACKPRRDGLLALLKTRLGLS